MSRLSRSQSSFVPKSSRCWWAPVAPLTSTPAIGFAPPNVVLARDFFRVGLLAGDWSACDSECTPCDSMGQGGTQLVGARHSFGRHQDSAAVAWDLRPELDRSRHAQRLRLIRPRSAAQQIVRAKAPSALQATRRNMPHNPQPQWPRLAMGARVGLASPFAANCGRARALRQKAE